ncbi:UvrD-helicase domain-containing protein [Mucilaginibacter kameinonensis]|uniref:UvrD-helicase domain-containing protein n=1 Tax=Mucilaginibacter kameinonensis TaxID=452286 RepID=UPI000EF82E97|nr:UvrD-helicase domain-containing protein [Mucilaginibacter kameinonensis]
MPQEIKITDEQIRLSEDILLPASRHFDNERLDFIKDLGTFDLHAVPGSGKTTALLAKLLALEQHLPFEDGSGILVLSHTNAAVDEIRNKIGSLCPRLFNCPSFVGTIQSFTDLFLTIPYYKIVYRKRPVRIDDDIYQEHHHVDYGFQKWLDNRPGDGKKLLHDYRLRDGDQLTFRRTTDAFPFGKKTKSFQTILALKKKLREEGFICYDDAYILAMEYLDKFPRMINIINKRFKYVFVDEMQDMDAYQYALLEVLFCQARDVGYQRIGDKNQSIYSNDDALQAIWEERSVKEFNGSHRLQPLVAAMVEPLAINPIPIKAQKTNVDGSPININPILFVYDNDTIEEVIPSFAREIKKLADSRLIDTQTEHTFKAIAWTTQKDGDDRNIFCLNHYHPDFSREQQKLQINYPCLESYLHYFTPGTNKLASIRKSLLNGLLRVLRIEGISHPHTGRTFSKRSFLDYLKIEHPESEPRFKLFVFKCSKMVAEGQIPQALRFFSRGIEASLQKFGTTIKHSRGFMTTSHEGKAPVLDTSPSATTVNQYIQDGIVIDVATVHSIKGQTHTCTLYMESFYQANVGKKGQYESTRIADQLKGIAIDEKTHKYIKQSLKMAYVGFSRPTHLLAFAIHRSRYDSHYAGTDMVKKWDVRVVHKK